MRFSGCFSALLPSLIITAGLFLPLSAGSQAPARRPANAKATRALGPTLLDREFVQKFRTQLAEQPREAIAMTVAESSKKDGALAEELRLLGAEALIVMGHTLAAQSVMVDVATRAIGTSQGAWALSALDQLATTVEVDESLIEELAYEFDGPVEQESPRSMLAWFRARALQRRGYPQWALQALSQIGTETQWQSDRLFDRASELLSDGKADEAEAAYEDLLKRPLVRASTRQFAELNRARLIFEKGDYALIVKTVRKLDLPTRERARALLEMAWSRYYLRDYGKALGLLQVVDSAYFDTLRSAEADLLRMVIERDLCRYDLVKETAKSFRERYQGAFKQIETRLPLAGDANLKQMALQSRNLQRRATLIFRYRTEKKALADESFKLLAGFNEYLAQALTTREKKIEAEIERRLDREIERVASGLIELRDQVSFLEYEASIRPLTKAPVADDDYLPKSASKTRFEKLYWPVSNEAWWDELETYEVLIRGRCQEPLSAGAYSRPAVKPVKKPEPKEEEYDEEEEDDE